MLHSPRNKTVETEDGPKTKRIVDCDYWYFFAETMSKGKKNDTDAHNVCLDRITECYADLYSKTGRTLRRIRGPWTDQCPTQCRNKKNWWNVAAFPERHNGIQLKHDLAELYDFKGPWDSAGKVVKHFLSQEELEGRRSPTALEAFKNCLEDLSEPENQLPHKEWEERSDPRILEKPTWTCDKRHFGFVTETVE